MQTPPSDTPPPFAGASGLMRPTVYDLARIEGARIGQLELCAPSTIPGLFVSPSVSPKDVYEAELKHGCVPIVLRKPPPPGSVGPTRLLKLKVRSLKSTVHDLVYIQSHLNTRPRNYRLEANYSSPSQI